MTTASGDGDNITFQADAFFKIMAKLYDLRAGPPMRRLGKSSKASEPYAAAFHGRADAVVTQGTHFDESFRAVA